MGNLGNSLRERGLGYTYESIHIRTSTEREGKK